MNKTTKEQVGQMIRESHGRQCKTNDKNYVQQNEIPRECDCDGYHTWGELYEYRLLYNAGLFNEWARLDLYDVHKSKKHHDGEDCFEGGWFIVCATTPEGQISNHYELKDWDLFNCEEREYAEEWDGHTPQDVAKTLRNLNNTQ